MSFFQRRMPMTKTAAPLLEKRAGDFSLIIHDEVKENDQRFVEIAKDSYLDTDPVTMVQAINRTQKDCMNFCTNNSILSSFIDVEYQWAESYVEREWLFTLMPVYDEKVIIPSVIMFDDDCYSFDRLEAGILVAQYFASWNRHYATQVCSIKKRDLNWYGLQRAYLELIENSGSVLNPLITKLELSS